MKNRLGEKTTAKKLANEIFADYIDQMLDGALFKYTEYLDIEYTEKEQEAIQSQLLKLARRKLKGTGYTNLRIEKSI